MKEKIKINQENSNQKFGKYERKEKRKGGDGKKGKMRWGSITNSIEQATLS